MALTRLATLLAAMTAATLALPEPLVPASVEAGSGIQARGVINVILYTDSNQQGASNSFTITTQTQCCKYEIPGPRTYMLSSQTGTYIQEVGPPT